MKAEPVLLSDVRRQIAQTDFRRNVHCVMGLPIDAMSLKSAVARVAGAVSARTRCVLSTPNVNILLGSHKDPAYRDSLIRADLSIADGAPLVWIARLLGIPIAERVGGSDLFEALSRGEGGPLSVYFFGGPEGAAAAACSRLNQIGGPLHCAGSMSPGFGTIEELSKPPVVEHINKSKPDFLIVAIAAKKAQMWIEHNHHELEPPVMGALGALVNFVSGRIVRAPHTMQRLGLEWLWRIKEEPALWRRYATDGFALLRLVVTRVLPALVLRIASALHRRSALAQIDVEVIAERTLLTLRGTWISSGLDVLRNKFHEATQTPSHVDLDLKAVDHIDHAFIGLLMLLYGHQQEAGRSFRIIAISPSAKRIVHLNCAGFLLRP